MIKLSRRDKRALSILGVVAGIMGLLFLVILPVYDAVDQVEEDLNEKEQLLGRYVQALREEEIYRAQLRELDRILGHYRERLLDAQESAVATAQLEEIVRNLASRYEIQVARSNPLQERKIGERYAKITLQINLQSDMGQLTNFLYGLSTHGKFLLVEDFYLNSFRARDELRIQPRMNISGFIRLS